jgi:hypothetical protein
MHDNNQYEIKSRKLLSDIENSQRKAAALEQEMTRINEDWELQYEEAVIMMR